MANDIEIDEFSADNEYFTPEGTEESMALRAALNATMKAISAACDLLKDDKTGALRVLREGQAKAVRTLQNQPE